MPHSNPSPLSRALLWMLGTLLLLPRASWSSCEAARTALDTSIRATYSTQLYGLPISSEHRMAPGADGYEVVNKGRVLGFTVLEQSRFRLSAENRLQPLEYRYRRGSEGDKQNLDLRFDWKKHIVVSQRPNDDWQLPLEPLTQDALSQQEQLRLDLICQGSRFDSVTYPVVRNNKMRHYTYVKLEEALLDTAVGPLKTVVIRKVDEKAERDTKVWMAIDWDYLLVKLQYREKNGELYRLELDSAELGDRPVTAFQPAP